MFQVLRQWLPSISGGAVAASLAHSGVRGLQEAGDSYRIQLDSKFVRDFETLQANLMSSDGATELNQLVASMEESHRRNLEYRDFCESIDDRECPICLGIIGPNDDLLRSIDPSCGAFHVFHRGCLPARVRRKGCPVCCRPMPQTEPGHVTTPFAVERDGAPTPQ